MGKRLQRAVLILLFLFGLAVFCYPYAHGLFIDREMESAVRIFQNQTEPSQPSSTVIVDSQDAPTPRSYPELWADMTAYNETIFAEEQSCMGKGWLSWRRKPVPHYVFPNFKTLTPHR